MSKPEAPTYAVRKTGRVAKDCGRAPQTPQSPTPIKASPPFTHLKHQFILSLHVDEPKHLANDSMLRVSIPSHHRDVSVCVPRIRHLIRTVSYPAEVHISPSRRLLSLHASHIPEGSRSSSDEQLRNERAKDERHGRSVAPNDSRSDRWKLTVGIEIHAQLNTERKLFSGTHANLCYGIIAH